MNNAEIISAIATVEEKYQKGDIDKQAFEDTVDQSGAKKIRTEEHIFSARNYTAPLEIDDESQIPEEYFKVTYDVDNTKIRNALKEGKEVPGVHLGTNRQVTIK